VGALVRPADLATLARLDEASRALARCTDLGELKKIRDTAAALHAYSKAQKLSAECQRYAVQVVVEAEARLGEMERERTPDSGIKGPGRGKKNPHPSGGGFSKTSSAREKNRNLGNGKGCLTVFRRSSALLGVASGAPRTPDSGIKGPGPGRGKKRGSSGDRVFSDKERKRFRALARLGKERRAKLLKAATVQDHLRRRGAALDTILDAAEIKLRAERRLGELAKTAVKQHGARDGKRSDSVSPRLRDTFEVRRGLPARNARNYRDAAVRRRIRASALARMRRASRFS
jgi:hypothetical protein